MAVCNTSICDSSAVLMLLVYFKCCIYIAYIHVEVVDLLKIKAS